MALLPNARSKKEIVATKEKASKEYEQFSKTQRIDSDFDRFSRNLLKEKD